MSVRIYKEEISIIYENGTNGGIYSSGDILPTFNDTTEDITFFVKGIRSTIVNYTDILDKAGVQAAADFEGIKVYLSTIVNFKTASGGSGAVSLVPLVDAVNISWTLDNNAINTITLAGNRTLDNPSVLSVGTYVLYVIQDVIGSRTLAYGTAFKFPNGNVPTLASSPNAVDILTFVCDGISMHSVKTPNFL